MNLPGLDQLEVTPEILRLLMAGLSEEDASWKPAPNCLSIAEALEHLSHAEGHCFRARVEAMVERDNPPIEPYDPEVYFAAGQYSGRSAEDSFDHFEEQRELNLEYLRALPASAAGRAGAHSELGMITVAHLLNEWAFHDIGQITQIAEIIRSLKYYPRMGPFQSASRDKRAVSMLL
jgi:DinB family protein